VAALSGAIDETFVSQQSANESTGTIGSQNSTTQVVGVQTGGC
jgi:hypothetical protein